MNCNFQHMFTISILFSPAIKCYKVRSLCLCLTRSATKLIVVGISNPLIVMRYQSSHLLHEAEILQMYVHHNFSTMDSSPISWEKRSFFIERILRSWALFSFGPPFYGDSYLQIKVCRTIKCRCFL